VKEQLGRTFSHMNWPLWVFGMCWRRLYRVLDSCIVNTRPWPKHNASRLK